VRAYNIGISAINLSKLKQVTSREAGVIMRMQILVGLSPRKFGRAKTSKPLRNFRQLQN